MEVIQLTNFHSRFRFSSDEFPESVVILGKHFYSRCESSENARPIDELKLWSFMQSDFNTSFKRDTTVMREVLRCMDGKYSSEHEVSNLVASFYMDDRERNSLQIMFMNILAAIMNLRQGIVMEFVKSVNDNASILVHSELPSSIAMEEANDGGGDDRQKRKQTDSKHEGDKGKTSRHEGESTSSGASGAGGGGGSSGDGGDGGDGGDDRKRKEPRSGPQSAKDEAMEEDEEKDDVKDLDITNFYPKAIEPAYVEPEPVDTNQANREAAELRAAAMEAAEAERRAAAAERRAAAAVVAAAGTSGNADRTDEEDPEQGRRAGGSPDTPSDGTPTQTPTPPPDVTDATVASDV